MAGPQTLIDWLWNRARTSMFSTALPPSTCAAACAALDIIQQEPQRRAQLLRLSAIFREKLIETGLPTPPNCCGPIIPVLLGEPGRAVSAAQELEARGFLVPAIRPPTVPAGSSRLRITLTCAHDEDDVDQLVNALSDVLGTSRKTS